MTGMDLFIPATLLKTLLYASIGLPCAAADLDTRLVPRANLLFLLFAMIAATPAEDLPGSLLGAGTGISVFFLVRKLTRNGLGLADVWMAGTAGAFGGAGFFALSSLAAIVLTVPQTVCQACLKSKQGIAFLPALSAGSIFLLLARIFSGRS